MGILESVILGIVQGIAEFLPISSSAHLIVVSEAMGGKPLSLDLNVALHMGTLLAVLIYFWRDWWGLFDGVVVARFARKTRSPEAEKLLSLLLVGSIPAGVLGLTLKDQIEYYLHDPLVVCIPLILVGVLLWRVDKKSSGEKGYEALTLKGVFCIGIAQACALVPGVSRSGATILGGLFSGLSREASAKFSFLLGTPAMLGAFLLELDGILGLLVQPVFLTGVLVSFGTGCLAMYLFFKFLRKFGFGAFALYRSLLAIGIFFWFS